MLIFFQLIPEGGIPEFANIDELFYFCFDNFIFLKTKTTKLRYTDDETKERKIVSVQYVRDKMGIR